MSATTISSYVQKTINPGQDGYGLTLVITSAGTVAGPSGTSPGAAIYGNLLNQLTGIVINDGVLLGGNGGATGASAVELTFFDSFVNGGTIIGGAGSLGGGDAFAMNTGVLINTGSIYDRGTGVQAEKISNSGSIGGGDIGVLLNGGSMYNSGTVSGGVDAIYSDGGDHLGLTVAPGAVFNGDVFDEIGDGTLVLAGTGAGNLNMNSSFIGFTGITFAPGSDWTLEGAGFELALGQTIAGFGPGDTLVLDGFAATSESFAPGIGLVLSNGSESSTLAVTRPLPGNSFAVTSNGGNTTIATDGTNTALISIISTLYANEVTPGAANYAADLTITHSGTVASPGTLAISIAPGLAAASIFNAGDITAASHGDYQGIGISGGYLSPAPGGSAGAYVENSGTIDSQIGIRLLGGTVVNSGDIRGSWTNPAGLESYPYGAGISKAHLIVNTGSIYGGQFGVDAAGGATLINSGTIAASRYEYAVRDVGSLNLIITPGAAFDGRVSTAYMTSELTLAGSGAGTLDMGSSFHGFQTIDFAAGVDWVLQGNTAELAEYQIISGFTVGDTIVLDGFAATSKVYAGDTNLLLFNETGSVTIGIVGSFTNGDFLVSDNAQGGTDISVLCYLRGTRLMAPGGERLVEDLAIGDVLLTRFGGVRPIKWIGRQSYAPRFAGRHKTPVRIAAGALGDGHPLRDLLVSPGHSVLLADRLILARDLVNGVSITQPAATADIDYFLIEFETHDCVLAEGIWAESFADGPGLRAQFHNAAAFHALYPHHEAPGALQLCAPRPERGPALAAALAPIITRAAAGLAPGPLRGFIDICTDDRIEGWAQDEAHPELPQILSVFDGGTMLGIVLACDYRADLAAAGIGSGRCHFRFALRARPQNAIRILRVSDGAEIFMTQDCHRAA